MAKAIEILGPPASGSEKVLSREALDFVGKLHREFHGTREKLLQQRLERQKEWDAGAMPRFLPESEATRRRDWKIAPTPADLQNRRVEITGPVERKMMINAF